MNHPHQNFLFDLFEVRQNKMMNEKYTYLYLQTRELQEAQLEDRLNIFFQEIISAVASNVVDFAAIYLAMRCLNADGQPACATC